MRWLWIDRFIEFQSGKAAKAVKNLSMAEDYFAEHFPGYPVMPGSLMLEGLAQTGGILAGEARGFKEKVILAKIPFARFFREAVPGEQLIYSVDLVDIRDEMAVVRGTVLVRDEVIVEAEIFFAHLDQARTKELFGDFNFVFSGELKQLLGLNKITTPTAQ